MSTSMLGGIFGRPFVDLEPYVDVGELAALDDEISLGLTEVAVGYTGGSHKSMGIVPPSAAHDPYADYGQVIARMTRAEFARFVALSDTPEAFDLDRRAEYEFGEERPWPLSRRQMLYLEYRHGVYFPWKVYYELIPNLSWEERAASDGKAFTDEARRVFPRTVAFIERLPFAELGRCNLLGLQSNDHGTIHRDAEDEPSRRPLHHPLPARRQAPLPVGRGAPRAAAGRRARLLVRRPQLPRRGAPIRSFATRSASTASSAPIFSAGWRVTCVASTDLCLHRAAVLDGAACARWAAGVYAARADWTPCFEGVQFTLGRAYYTHLEEDRADEYFATARASDATVERALPALQARVRGILGELVGAPVTPRPGWCGPGVHIFPAGDWLSQNGGDIHFDTEGLGEAELAARLPALSAIFMLQPPRRGGGLRVWDALWDGRDDEDDIAAAARAPEAPSSSTRPATWW